MKIDIRLPKETRKALQDIATLAGVTIGTVVKVCAACEVMRQLKSRVPEHSSVDATRT